ncbi:trehalose utilization protein ThuA [Agromyces protaetiae]|uniref:Trehalose utilization protein ThuA n=1 Tax=Agromyces protaetiae TaxID=2509455 RepID=A0A4P6F9Z1_9MICO|nr:ThuA domain-containing protein [Agromyces protaetiae]QAY72386.1 trehalose utilization protein ThuA [Agromyces protaetiae]
MTDAPASVSNDGGALRVLVWNEGVHERRNEPPTMERDYPQGIHGAIADALEARLPGARIATATLADPEHGLVESVLEQTDVLLWWGHVAHDEVSDEVVARVQRHVLAGMGFVVLHSGHHSKPFRALMGTTCNLRWRNAGERELVWTVDPTHPIARGIPSPIVIPAQEMYGEQFDIPKPDDLVFVSSFAGGEVFRSGATWTRGRGRIFYFSPGDQEYPVYRQAEIGDVLANGVRWVAQPDVPRAVVPVENPAEGWFAGA